MLRNYLISAFRNLLKDRLYTSINTFGLAIGIATGFIIFSWVKLETSYDKYHVDSERIFRVATRWDDEPNEGYATAYPMIKSRVLNQFPEVEASARIFDVGFLGSKTRVAVEDKLFTDDKLFYADSSFFDVYHFRIRKGNPKTLFKYANSVVITGNIAQKYFGSEDPIGKVLLLDGKKELIVTGVMENIPVNTHFQFDLLANMMSHPWIKGAEEALWSGISFHTYVKVKEGAQADALQSKINQYLDDFPNDTEHYGKELNMVLQPVTDIHLKSDLKFELNPPGNSQYVFLFITIAILVVVVAVINYVNLATARYSQRTKEVGVRKVMGAFRSQLIMQFLMESIFISLASLFLAIMFIELTRPLWIKMIGNDFVESVYQLKIFIPLLLATLSVGLLSGVFPSVVLSSAKPSSLFRPGLTLGGGFSIRKSLLVFQFATSILLMVCTVVIYQQLQFIKQKQLGYDKDHVVVVHIGYEDVLMKYETLKQLLLANPSVISASATSQIPTNILTGENIDVANGESFGVYYVSVDKDFFRTMDIPLQEGESMLSSLDTSTYANKYVFSESALKLVGWEKDNAMNQQVKIRHGNMQPGPVIGIANDFHFQSLHHVVAPLVFEFTPRMYEYLLVRISPENTSATLSFMELEWKKIAGEIPFDYSFLDQEYNNLYKNEQRVGSLFLIFAIVASVIALLGLFAVTSFTVVRKTREIGIRKILGATTTDVMKIISGEFAKPLTIALVFALPMAYYFMNQWLLAFAYKTNLSLLVFLLAGGINMLFAFATLSYHSIKAAGANPIDTIKSE